MIAVPCPTSREYNCAFPTGMRLSWGIALRLLSVAVIDAGRKDVAHAHAKTATASIAFMALTLYQTVGWCKLEWKHLWMNLPALSASQITKSAWFPANPANHRSPCSSII